MNVHERGCSPVGEVGSVVGWDEGPLMGRVVGRFEGCREGCRLGCLDGRPSIRVKGLDDDVV